MRLRPPVHWCLRAVGEAAAVRVAAVPEGEGRAEEERRETEAATGSPVEDWTAQAA